MGRPVNSNIMIFLPPTVPVHYSRLEKIINFLAFIQEVIQIKHHASGKATLEGLTFIVLMFEAVHSHYWTCCTSLLRAFDCPFLKKTNLLLICYFLSWPMTHSLDITVNDVTKKTDMA